MRESLVRHWQLMVLAAYRPPDPRDSAGALEVVDGFKRLRAARELGRGLLRVRVLPLGGAETKAAIGILNHERGLTELEEGVAQPARNTLKPPQRLWDWGGTAKRSPSSR